MRVRVLLFGPLRERMGTGALDLSLEEGSTVRSAVKKLREAFKGFHPDDGPLLYAINEAFESDAAPLADRDTLAVMTPVSGG